MKINVLYVGWGAMLLLAAVLGSRFVATSETSVFGAAESDGQILNATHAAIIHKILVRAGDKVQRGDTLILLHRPELNQAATLKQSELQQDFAQQNVQNEQLDRELERLRSDHAARLADLGNQLELLLSEQKTQAELQKLVGGNTQVNGKDLLSEKIAVLRKNMQTERERYATQAEAIRQQRRAEGGVRDTRENTFQTEMNFLEQDKNGLVLLAPMDGYVENIYVFENEAASQFRPLLKLNPKRPDKVKGFLPESAEAVFRLGDEVELISLTRSHIRAKGVLTGGSASVVELPLRLRRFQNISSWGREIYVDLPDNNEFFIGEKIIIHLPQQPKPSGQAEKTALVHKAG